MITIRGRQYDMPAHLMTCPKCRRGTLAWDGHWSWQCNHTRADSDGSVKPACRNSLALSGLFESEDVEFRFTCSQVDLSSLQLSAYALKLVVLEEITLSWITDALYTQQFHALERLEESGDTLAALDRLMRKPPARTNGLHGRRL